MPWKGTRQAEGTCGMPNLPYLGGWNPILPPGPYRGPRLGEHLPSISGASQGSRIQQRQEVTLYIQF
jgi:hypothetical protein